MRAGLPVIEAPVTFDDLLAGTPVVASLEGQAPVWPPGSAHGYHAFTYGFLLGEVVRRVTGRSIGQVFAEEVAAPPRPRRPAPGARSPDGGVQVHG